jgi:hypothetical protein
LSLFIAVDIPDEKKALNFQNKGRKLHSICAITFAVLYKDGRMKSGRAVARVVVLWILLQLLT